MDAQIIARYNDAILHQAMRRYCIAKHQIKPLEALESFIYEFERGAAREGASVAAWRKTTVNLVPTNDLDKNLSDLAKRHKELSGTQVNWLGTYQHAAQVWQKGLELQKA